MATGSYLTPIYSRSQSEVQGDLHKVGCPILPTTLKNILCPSSRLSTFAMSTWKTDRESTEGNAAERARFAPETTFTAFFNICNEDDFARTLFYHQIPRYYTWDSKNKMWSRRKIGQSLFHHPGIRSTDAIGRVYTVHPNNSECFHLRLLLPEVPGPTSFQYLKTIEDYL
ncbi:uncharacterized protein TNCV_3023041 [Trichonephila clavipes]|nr:uncharacterized protein TNCV_3023041 [Trichonephila clavipes]